MKTLVFGGSGAIGKIYCKNNPDAISISSKDCELSNEHKTCAFFKKNGFEESFNVLMLSTINKFVQNDFSSYCTNIQMALNLVWFVRDKCNKFIFASSADVYGHESQLGIFNEWNPKPDSFYAKSKLVSEKVIQDCLSNVAILRLVGVLGMGTSFMDGEAIRLTNNGETLRQFIHVDDLCAVINMIFDSDFTGVLNTATPHPRSMKEWCKLTGKEFVLSKEKTDRDFDLTFNSSRMRLLMENHKWKY